MGVFQNFPYLNWEDLNIDWVLQVCRNAEKTIKNLNVTIEDTVRPMLQQQLVSVESYYNKLKFQFDNNLNKMYAEQQKLQGRVNLQLNNNLMEMYKLKSDVNISNKNTIAKLEIEISNLRNETQNLIAKYDAIWGSMSATQQAQIKKIIESFNLEYNEQLVHNAAKMQELEQYVNMEVTAMQSELQNANFKIRQEMSSLKLYVDGELQHNLEVLNAFGDILVAEVEKQSENVTEYYRNMQILFTDFTKHISTELDLKANLQYVDGELADIRKQILVCNGNIPVINPVNSKPDTLQNTLQDIFQNINPWRLTAEEYDKLYLTAEEFDWISANFMTAEDYDEAGKFYLKIWRKMYNKLKEVLAKDFNVSTKSLELKISDLDKRETEHFLIMQQCCNNVNYLLQKELFMYSPISGHKTSLKNVLVELADIIRSQNSLTAEEYDKLNLTAEQYDSKNLTAYEYDWFGKNLL